MIFPRIMYSDSVVGGYICEMETFTYRQPFYKIALSSWNQSKCSTFTCSACWFAHICSPLFLFDVVFPYRYVKFIQYVINRHTVKVKHFRMTIEKVRKRVEQQTRK